MAFSSGLGAAVGLCLAPVSNNDAPPSRTRDAQQFKSQRGWPNGWWLNCTDGLNGVEATVDNQETHEGNATTHLVSSREADFSKNDVPKLTKVMDASNYRGSRLRMNGWIKTKAEVSAHFWIRVDGDWQDYTSELFDNMHNRPIAGTTDWTNYSLVVEVPETSTQIVYGLFLYGPGELWLGGVSFEAVDKSVSITGTPQSDYFGN